MKTKITQGAVAALIVTALAAVVYAATPARLYVHQTEIPTNRNTFTIALADTFTTGPATADKCIVQNLDTTDKMCVSFRTVAGSTTAQGPIVLQPKVGATTFDVEINEIDTERDLGGLGPITHVIVDTDACDGGSDAAVTNQIICTQTPANR